MPRQPRVLRRVIWGFVLLCTAGVVLTTLSLHRTFRPLDFRAFGAHYELWIENGQFGALRTTTKGTLWDGSTAKIYWGGRGAPASLRLGFRRMKASAMIGTATANTDGALVPIWFVALVLGTGWVFLVLVRERRRQRTGCPRCGYDLDGLTTDRCPECGEPMACESSAA